MTLSPTPDGAAPLTLTTNTWLANAFARDITTSISRSRVVVSVGWMITSAPSQASWRATSGKLPSKQIARPTRPLPGMSNVTNSLPGSSAS